MSLLERRNNIFPEDFSRENACYKSVEKEQVTLKCPGITRSQLASGKLTSEFPCIPVLNVVRFLPI